MLPQKLPTLTAFISNTLLPRQRDMGFQGHSQTFVIDIGMQCCERERDYRPDTEKSCSAPSSMP